MLWFGRFSYNKKYLEDSWKGLCLKTLWFQYQLEIRLRSGISNFKASYISSSPLWKFLFEMKKGIKRGVIRIWVERSWSERQVIILKQKESRDYDLTLRNIHIDKFTEWTIVTHSNFRIASWKKINENDRFWWEN